MKLRDYQQAAHDAVIEHIKKSTDSCVIEAATGSGKSHIIAAVSDTMHRLSNGKHILCLAPSAELVTQNREKYLATGNPASIFSASAGAKCLRHPVVFGTPGTVKNQVHKFGGKFCAVIIDECHRITPTIKDIIESIKNHNKNLRVIGLSATPYRMGTGYIYQIDQRDKAINENAYFVKCVYSINARDLLSRSFLTPITVGAINAEQYKTSHMQLNKLGQFDKGDIDQAYHGHGRKTAAIIADIVEQAKYRNGVMIFAATVRHAEECIASLPPALSALITGETHKKDRQEIIRKFRAQQIKYLVNVSVLTTGFDATHVDVVAILRATESASLLQQIIGRGMRLHDNKQDCLLLDYAENLERHCPDGDIFKPEIDTPRQESGGVLMTALCPQCGNENEFAARKNDEGYQIDEHGYFVDLSNERIKTEFGDIPAHYGRRCTNYTKKGAHYERCTYRWTFKECPHCEAENDIAARYCTECKGEIVDPNEKLRADFAAFKKDPTKMQTDRVLSWDVRFVVSRSGNECIRVDFVTEYRKFSVWYQKNPTFDKARRQLATFMSLNGEMPATVTYIKNQKTDFFDVYGYNQPPDECPI